MYTESEPPPRLVDLLTSAQRLAARSTEAALGDADLTLDQWRALRALLTRPGLTMGELSDSLHTPAPTTTRLVDGLVDRALVYRRASPHDRRRVETALTDSGVEALTRAEALVDAHERIDGTGIDEPLLHDLRGVLEHVTAPAMG